MALFSKKSTKQRPNRDELLRRIAVGDAFEYCCFEAEVVPPPGYVWPNQFFVANPNAWSDDGFEDVATLFSRAEASNWSWVDQGPKLHGALTAHQNKGGTIPEMCGLRHAVTVFLALFAVDQAKRMAAADPVAAESWLQANPGPSIPGADDPNAARLWIAELPPQVARIAETLRVQARDSYYPESFQSPGCEFPDAAFKLALGVVLLHADKAGSTWGYSPRD
jgi:hypothetical protein